MTRYAAVALVAIAGALGGAACSETPNVDRRIAYANQHAELSPERREAIATGRVETGMTMDEVRAMVRERMRTFGPGGGYVFNTIHNLQAGVPVENIVALYEAVAEYRTYPLD